MNKANSIKKPTHVWLAVLIILALFATMAAVHAEIPANPNYKGSEYCLGCHSDKTAQRQSSHAKSWQTADSSSVVDAWPSVGKTHTLDFTTYAEGSTTPDASITLMHPSTDVYQVKIGEKTYNVARTYGGLNNWKQRYMTKDVDDTYRDDNYYILPFQYNQDPNTDTPRWQPYHNMQDWYTPSRTVEKNCAGCHNTGLNITFNEQGYVTDYNFTEMNIGCEKCHGYLGIEVPDAVTMPILNQNIVNPAKLSKDRANEVCGQCHMRGKSVPDNIFGYPWNDTTNSGFLPGENLSEYYEDHGEYYKDASGNITASEAHHQQWEDFQTSVHYQNPNDIESAPSECFNCHNPHNLGFETEKGTYNETQVENNELCLGCHEPHPPFNNNTTHFTDKYTAMSGIECTKCHMTKTSKSAAWNTITGTPQGDLKQGDIHSHRFNPIEPKYSGDNSNPTGLVNSCNQAGCHTDKTQFDYDEIADYIKGVAPPPVTGDINGDGNVDMDDAILVAQMVIGKYPADVEKADFNENGRVDIGDASKIAFYVVGKIPSL